MNAPDRITAWDETSKVCAERGFQEGEWTTESIQALGETFTYILATPAVLADQPEVRALLAAAVKAERERCARVVDRRAEEYDREFGSYDYSTGVTEYPGTGSESMEEWESIAAAIRATPAGDGEGGV